MEYSFDIDFAKKYGVDEAIMIKSFQYWIRLNKANKSNFYDGHYWTYNTISALSELFPFWSEKQVRTILQNLLKLNILIKGNYNKFGFDRTIWYAFENEAEFLQINNSKKAKATSQIGKSILPNGQMELTKQENGTSQMVNTIPITNSITNSITNTDKEKSDFSFSENSEQLISLNDKKQTLDILPAVVYQKTKKVKEKATQIYPTNFSPAMIRAVQNFIEYRKEIKKPFKSEKSQQTKVNQWSDQIEAYGEAIVLDSIESAIANGWQGTFIDMKKVEQQNKEQNNLNNQFRTKKDENFAHYFSQLRDVDFSA
jgi:hypothetical protein